MDQPATIPWGHLERERFEAVVAQLLIAEHHGRDGIEIRIPNGKGGDRGIDAAAMRDEQVEHIWQFKHFPEGMSGGWAPRRKQVQKSFQDALKARHGHTDWTLVIPAHATDNDREFVANLAGQSGVRVHLMDRVELQRLEVLHPQVVRWATHDEVTERFTIWGQEKAALASPQDAEDRYRALHELTNAGSRWHEIIHIPTDNGMTKILRARHPDSHLHEPLTWNLTARFSPDQVQQRLAFERALRYGAGDTVYLDENMIADWSFDGPAMFAPTGTFYALELTAESGDLKGERAELQVRRADGTRIRLPGTVTHHGQGEHGISFTFELAGGLIFSIYIDTTEKTLTMQFTADIEGQRVVDVAALVELSTLMNSGVDAKILIGPKIEAPLTTTPTNEHLFDERTTMLVNDLAYLDEQLDHTFFMPDDLTGAQVVEIRIARLLLEGHAVPLPYIRGMVATIDPEIASTAASDDFLPTLTNPVAMRAPADDFEVTIMGETFPIGLLALWHPHLLAEDADEHLAALRRGEGGGRVVTFAPADGELLVAQKVNLEDEDQESLTRELPAGGARTITTWDVPGIKNPPTKHITDYFTALEQARPALPAGE